MSTDPDNPIVDRSSLGGIVEYFHDRGGVPCLGYRDAGRCRPISPGDFDDGLGEEEELVPYLVIEEVFWKVEGQGENWEQESPNPHCRMACRSRRNTVRGREGDRNSTY